MQGYKSFTCISLHKLRKHQSSSFFLFLFLPSMVAWNCQCQKLKTPSIQIYGNIRQWTAAYCHKWYSPGSVSQIWNDWTSRLQPVDACGSTTATTTTTTTKENTRILALTIVTLKKPSICRISMPQARGRRCIKPLSPKLATWFQLGKAVKWYVVLLE